MKALLNTYLRRLYDLTSRNRSLFLLRLLKQHDLDLFQLGEGMGEAGFSIIRGLVAGDRDQVLCPVTDSRDHGSNVLSRKVRQIVRRDSFITEERGTRDLYLTWAYLQGAFSGGQPVKAPLIFFPVTIGRKANNWVINRRHDEPVSFNKALLLAYSHFQGTAIPEKLYDRDLSDLDTDMQVFRTALYQLLKENHVEINFNPETFVNRLQPFKDQLKADFMKTAEAGELMLMPTAVLGFFSTGRLLPAAGL